MNEFQWRYNMYYDYYILLGEARLLREALFWRAAWRYGKAIALTLYRPA